MKICYFVTASNEYEELKNLLTVLTKEIDFYKHDLVILMDSETVTLEVRDLVDELVFVYDYQDPSHNIITGIRPLNNNFAEYKNWILGKTNADYIFQIDADEVPSIDTLKYLDLVLEPNSTVDIWLVERHNYVTGITPEYINLWGWQQNTDGLINFPDVQTRLFKNNNQIKWAGNVHERLQGGQRVEVLPSKMFLTHIKTLDKQIKQNNKYINM